MLKVDKKGNILRKDGSVLGTPKSTGGVYRSNNRTGRIDLETGKVYNKKDELLGEVDMSKFDCLVKALEKLAEKQEKIKKIKKAGKKKTKEEVQEELDMECSRAKHVQRSNGYVPGKDSEMIVSGRLGRICWPQKYPTETGKEFITLCKASGWTYTNWTQLSAKENLSEKILSEYNKYIDWYAFIKYHPERTFSDEFRKKYAKQLSI